MPRKKKYLKLAAFVMITIVLIAFIIIPKRQSSNEYIKEEIMASNYQSSNIKNTITYSNYIKDALLPDSPSGSKIEGNIVENNDDFINYEFNVTKGEHYFIEVEYEPYTEEDDVITRDILVDNQVLFEELQGVIFERNWEDENKDFLMKTEENVGFPKQIQKHGKIIKKVNNPVDMTDMAIYLDEGLHTLKFVYKNSKMDISKVSLVPAYRVKTYDEYIESYKKEYSIITNSDLEGKPIIVQGEDTYSKTSSMLVPVNNRTSKMTIPYHPSNIVLNCIGGGVWKQQGSGITWCINVPKSGLYKIGTRFLQADNRGFYSIRELRINGEIPFEEAKEIKFDYAPKFQKEYIGNEDKDYYFYLEEGENLIALSVSMGKLKDSVDMVNTSVKNFNMLYRRLSAVMGSTPDKYRDYNIIGSVPDMTDILKEQYYFLSKAKEEFAQGNNSSAKLKEIDKFLFQLEKIIQDPDSISKELKAFNDNITALGDWSVSVSQQPLLIDYFTIAGEDHVLTSAEGNLIDSIDHNVRSFIGSFTNDYKINNYENGKKEKKIEVWIAASTRDQYDIAQRMVNRDFANKDYEVDLKMVGADTVMPATLTGNGPDVALQLNYTMPANFAYRSAGYDLTQFTDFEQVYERFYPGSMEYFEYQGGYYGLPDQMSFPVMFYREDILNELNLKVPNTWEELIKILPYLKAENMSAWFVSTGQTTLGGSSSTATKPINPVFLSMLYQKNEELYRDNDRKSNLDNINSMMTFKAFTEFYTKQGFDLSINTVTRFRTGETPIIIDDFTIQNNISAAAPEINGMWKMAPIPGTVDENNQINRTTSCIVGTSMILKNIVEAKDTQNEAWEFLKWWTEKETQLEYAKEQKALFGDAAIHPVSNKEALLELTKGEEKFGFIEELQWVKGTKQVAGGYITGRCIENAFLSVVNDNLNAIDTLYSQIRFINTELENKRIEFKLED